MPLKIGRKNEIDKQNRTEYMLWTVFPPPKSLL